MDVPTTEGDLRLYAQTMPLGDDARVLFHDMVFASAPMAAVHDAMSARGPGLVRDAIAGLAGGPTLDLVGELVEHDAQRADAWPAPTLGEPRRHADRVLVPVVWTPSRTNPFLWGFDGDLAYAPVGPRVTQLTLSGTGDVARLDTSGTATAERVAQFAVRALLERLAERIAAP